MNNSPDIFSDSMLKLISQFGADINSYEINVEQVDFFAFQYSEEEIRSALDDGIDANFEDFIGEDGYASFDERAVLIYIKHQANMGSKRKFHFTSCPIVSQNISKDVYDTKFVMTTRRDGYFKVFDPYGKEKEVPLEPCGHCCNTAGIKINSNVEFIYSHLENKETKKRLKKRPKLGHNSSVSREFLDGYVWNWKGISKIIRARRNFTCEICQVNLFGPKHLLHVHHKNRDKKDNREENLHVLCVECHSNQEGHSHMKERFTNEIRLVRTLRQK